MTERRKAERALRVAMRVTVRQHGFGDGRERTVDLPEGADADGLLVALGHRPETALVFHDDAPLPGDAPLAEGMVLRVLRVVSGGSTGLSGARHYSRPTLP